MSFYSIPRCILWSYWQCPYPSLIVPDIRLGSRSLTSRFTSITPLYAPTAPGTADNIFITKSYDATSHFETVVEDVFDVWKRCTGKELELKKREVEVEA